MRKAIVGLFATIVAAALGTSLASAQTPLDPTGVLAGYIPPSQGGLSCTRYVNKRVTIMPVNCELACAVDFASAASRGLAFDYDFCLNTWSFSCKNQYERAMQKIKQGTCMNCLNDPGREALYPLYSSVVNTAKDQIYCDNSPSNTPFPDGHGFVSQQRDVVQCQNQIARSLAKAAKCLDIKCHQKHAELEFWSKPIRTSIAQCETDDVVKSCKARFMLSVSKAGPSCPACVDANAIWTSFHTGMDTDNGDIYCSDQATPTPTPTSTP